MHLNYIACQPSSTSLTLRNSVQWGMGHVVGTMASCRPGWEGYCTRRSQGFQVQGPHRSRFMFCGLDLSDLKCLTICWSKCCSTSSQSCTQYSQIPIWTCARPPCLRPPRKIRQLSLLAGSQFLLSEPGDLITVHPGTKGTTVIGTGWYTAVRPPVQRSAVMVCG